MPPNLARRANPPPGNEPRWLLLSYRWLTRVMMVFGVFAGLLVAWLLLPKALPKDVMAIHSVQQWIQPLHGVAFDEVGFRALLREDLAQSAPPYASPSAKWASATLPATRELPTSTDLELGASHRLWLRFSYLVPVDQAAHEPVGLYITRIMGGIGGGFYSLWVNGELVHANEAQWRTQWNHPVLVRLPLKFSQPGQTLHMVFGMPIQMSQGYAVGSALMGKALRLSPYQSLRELVQMTLPQATLFVVVLIGASSLHFWINRRAEETHLIMWLSSVAWLVCNLQFVMDFDGNNLVSAWYGSLVDSATGWAVLLIAMFFIRIEGRSPLLIERLSLTLVGGMTVLTLPAWGWHKNALLLQHYLHVVMGVSVLAVLTWRALKAKSLDMWLLVATILTMLVFGVHDLVNLTSQRAPDHVFLFPYTVIVVFGVFLHINQKRYVTALNNIDTLNVHLQQQIEEAKQRIGRSHEQRMVLSRQQALMEERQLVCSDVHDGLGSALTSAIVMAEKGQVDPQQMTAVLHDCMVEIQAVVDTIQTVPGYLTEQLALLEARLRPRLDAAGVSSSWDLARLPVLAWMDQAASNDVNRILQEALSNALKHANPTHVRVKSGKLLKDDREGVCIEVLDDGQGFELSKVTAGRGLKNLKRRTQCLHGDFDVISEPGKGTHVRVWMPCQSA